MDYSANIQSALFAINARLESLSESEKRVADYVLQYPKKVLHYNVRELAKQSSASQAAVIRFCKHLEFESFSNFKIRLARDVFGTYDERYVPDLDLESNTESAVVIHSTIERLQQSFAALERSLDAEEISRAADAILSAPKIALFGVGASGIVASDFMQKLARLGLPVFYTPDTDLQLVAASSIRSGECAFIVSYSGEKAEMVEVARFAKKGGATIITLTMDGPNAIQELADIRLHVPASERIYRQGASTSRINQLAVVDILYSLMLSSNLDASIEAIEQTMAATHR